MGRDPRYLHLDLVDEDGALDPPVGELLNRNARDVTAQPNGIPLRRSSRDIGPTPTSAAPRPGPEAPSPSREDAPEPARGRRGSLARAIARKALQSLLRALED